VRISIVFLVVLVGCTVGAAAADNVPKLNAGPMLAYLRSNGFKTFIVSGGGIEFMRPWTDQRIAARLDV
jgi:phosphoserine phosphatase